ncbi:MAG: T9SS type A sorting domain-containing protein [Fluviicola sp.]|nr:T9SS type A sorting domain-containing protein [Fluviicola sp.]
MKLITTFSFLLIFGVFNSQSQTTALFNAEKIDIEDTFLANSLNELINAYEVFEVPTKAIFEGLKSNNYQFTLNLGSSYSFDFNLSPNSIVAPNYLLRTQSSKSSIKPITSTYNGSINSLLPSNLRLSIRANHFSGVIIEGENNYCFEALSNYIAGENSNKIIVYQLKDINANVSPTCGEVKPSSFLEKMKSIQEKEVEPDKNLTNCSIIEIAVAADNSMLTKFGGDTSLVQTEIIDMLNLAELFYSPAPLEINYRLVETYITAPDEITLDSETDGNVILSDFRNFGNSSGFSNPFGVATMWTNRDFEFGGSFGTAGLAYINAVCGFSRYNIIEHLIPSLTQAHLSILYAHELGHNWSAAHTATNTINIMSPTVNATNTTWSAASITSITNKKATASCLFPCDIPFSHFSAGNTLICEGLSVAFTDTSHGNPTSFQWTFPGGSPSSSTLQNPSIQYNTAGTFDVKLVISNAQGTDSVTTSSYITVVSNSLIQPTVSVTGSIPFCIGDSVILGSSPAGNYLWSNSSTTQDIDVFTTGNYFVQISDAAGCTMNSDTTVVTVNSLPIVSVVLSPDAVCLALTPFTLTGGIPTGGIYSGNGVFGASFDPSSAGIGAHQINYTFTDLNSCTNSDSTTMTVESCAGVATIKNELDLLAYPNPFLEEIIIVFPKNGDDVRFILTNVLGQEVAKIEHLKVIANEKTSFVLPALSKGTYFLIVQDKDAVFIEKMLKK